MTKSIFNRYLWLAGLGGMLVTSVSYTAPGVIDQAPLFTATSTSSNSPSNIFFMLDDSGSMSWAMLSAKYWAACLYDPDNAFALKTSCPSTMQVDGSMETYGSSISNQTDLTKFTNLSAANLYEWRAYSPAVNVLYYNPNTDYQPWLKGDGSRYPQAVFTAAKDDPVLATSTVDLTGFSFVVASDTHGFSGAKPTIGWATPVISDKVLTSTTGPVVTGPVNTTTNTVVDPPITTGGNGSNTTTKAWYQDTLTHNTVDAISTSTLTNNYTTTTATNQVINRTAGPNGLTDFWDEHIIYTMSGSSLKQDAITYNPQLSTTPTSTTAGTAQKSPAVLGTLVTTGTNTAGPTLTNTSNTGKTTKNTYTIVTTHSITVTTAKTQNQTIDSTTSSTGSYALSLNPQTATTTVTTGLYSKKLGRLRTIAEEQQNIANWYQYYRQRINVAKGALSDVVDTFPDYRYGLSTIWNQVFVEVSSKTGTVTDTEKQHNIKLLSSLVTVSPGNTTPLPAALDAVGQYYAHTSTAHPDPITYACQHNFAVLMTDGYWNDDLNSTRQAAIGDYDGDGVGATHSTLGDVARYYYNYPLNVLTGNTTGSLSSTYTGEGVLGNAFDSNSRQHMVTFTMAFGLQGNLVPGGTDTTGTWPNPALTESGDNKETAAVEKGLWGNAINGADLPNIDDLWHAAYNGRGLYASAGSPEAIGAAFDRIFSRIAASNYNGSAATASFNTTTTNTLSGSNAVYLSQFALTSNVWSGDIVSYGLDPKTGAITGVGAVDPLTGLPGYNWSAAKQLDDLNATSLSAAAAARHIFTYNRSTKAGVPFQWASLSDTGAQASVMQKDLGTLPSYGLPGSSATIAAVTTNSSDAVNADALARLAYLRGDQTKEGNPFRTRSFITTTTGSSPVSVAHKNLLGDMIHSNPVLVAAPHGNWPARLPFPTTTGHRYSDFLASSYKNRTPLVYVGGNDGMLHGFNALTGNEAMAYIPQTLFSAGKVGEGLHYLTESGYTHRYYVDMPSVVEDVYIDTGTVGVASGESWHTVLVGGLMAGGKGIFALDVTDPASYGTEDDAHAKKIALWEFNNNDDADMGKSFSIPSIVMMNNGRWAAVFGNGYNSDGTNSSGKLGKGRAALFIAFLDGGVDGVWTDGTSNTPQDYIKIVVPTATDPTVTTVSIDCTPISLNCNGLSTPQTIDLNGDNIVDRIYAGDLKGNMWTFDVSKSILSGTQVASTDWRVPYGTVSVPLPLFTASHYKTPTTGTNPAVPTGAAVQQKLCGTTATPAVCVQPITSRPALLVNKQSYGANLPNVLVFFGTGQYVNLTDTGNTEMQSYYGVWDHGLNSLTPANLVEQTYYKGPFYDQSKVDITSKIRVMSKNGTAATATTCASTTIAVGAYNPCSTSIAYNNLASTKNTVSNGWFINLSQTPPATYPTAVSVGERQIVDSAILNEQYLFFNTWLPGQTTSTVSSTDLCSIQGNAKGSSFLMSIDIYTGGQPNQALFSLTGQAKISKTLDKVVLDVGTSGTSGTNAPTFFASGYTATGLVTASSFTTNITTAAQPTTTQYTFNSQGKLQTRGVTPGTLTQLLRRSWQELRSQ